MIDLHRLSIWRAVVASGSVSGAAANLGFTPATVSQHIIALQAAIGLPLYERRGRGIEPTAVGERLAEESSEVFESARRLEAFIEDLHAGPTPTLSIGSFASAARAWLPGVVADLTKEFPDVQWAIDIHTPGAAAGYRTRDIEIDEEVPAELPRALTGYRRRELAVDDFGVAVAADHPLSDSTEVRAADLRDESWIDHDMYDRTSGRVVRDACHAAGFEPRYVARSDDHNVALAMVAAGVGIAMLPRLAKGEVPSHVHTAPVVDPVPLRRVTMHVRDTSAHLDYVRRAVELIEARAGAAVPD
ncbi:LysR family transcriptional regulator [Janibacter cremeus]|uniref:DNA-binding transcriptional LysR family regulator n=1 Tax=Janibacter cremeus TaxID=1285192 RepID=A0A852VRS1_9MICO|nr:LysR family transcriptional regulator [Janibacter cremeus]NYF98130.1 DNA-binding transcriptional LysR family regulator [Janibacter cremeus]